MKLKLIMVGLCIAMSLNAQKKAVTETGEEVVLFKDGTWNYVNEEDEEKNEIPVNDKKYTREENSSFLLKSKTLPIGVWLNPKVWTFQKADENPAAEYELQLKGGDLYGMMITEEVEIPLESMRDIAVENAKGVAPDIKVIKEEFRTVNGLRILHMQMHGTIQGIKFAYFGYYYSDESGTLQFITYTSQKLMENKIVEVETLLNGVVLTN